MSMKHSSWKDNEIVYCHLLTQETLPVFQHDSYLMERPAGESSFLVFSLLMLLNCLPNMCRTLNPLDQLHKKLILRNILKTYLVYCSLNSASPYTFKYLNNGGSIQNLRHWLQVRTILQEDQMYRSQSVASQPKLWGISGTPQTKCNIIVPP